MILEEDPGTLINQVTSNFNITSDKASISRINESLATLEQARGMRAQESEDALRRLSRTLNTLRTNHAETISSHSSTAHSSHIASLDSQKFRTAKALTSLESENDRLSAQLADLQSKLQELELQGIEGGEEAQRTQLEDEVLLRLRVYRSLGLEADKAEEGEWNRMVVRGKGKGDVQVVNVEKKFSKFFYANYFWGQL